MQRAILALTTLAAPAVATAAPGDWVPTEQESALLQALSLRDGSPSCGEMEAGLPNATASLTAVVAHVSMPPWAPMRAAECLVAGHAVEVRADVVRWVTDPGLKGLGILALSRLDAMPADVAIEVASAAIERGPDPAGARVRVAKAANPAVSGLAVVKP